jgi:hypothetical protein
MATEGATSNAELLRCGSALGNGGSFGLASAVSSAFASRARSRRSP